uniref:PiggyBac transposable element-derived protein domain-containing protein n=1 Tax=Timema shepardi TaxID=629360 RepID=A0A7R9FV19_TIMSH|nr:unnamed protein product [Timema shepardi]
MYGRPIKVHLRGVTHPELEVGGAVVIDLVDKLSHGQYSIYLDNLLTSVRLLEELKSKGHYCTGNIRSNRIEKASLEESYTLKKKYSIRVAPGPSAKRLKKRVYDDIRLDELNHVIVKSMTQIQCGECHKNTTMKCNVGCHEYVMGRNLPRAGLELEIAVLTTPLFLFGLFLVLYRGLASPRCIIHSAVWKGQRPFLSRADPPRVMAVPCTYAEVARDLAVTYNLTISSAWKGRRRACGKTLPGRYSLVSVRVEKVWHYCASYAGRKGGGVAQLEGWKLQEGIAPCWPDQSISRGRCTWRRTRRKQCVHPVQAKAGKTTFLYSIRRIPIRALKCYYIWLALKCYCAQLLQNQQASYIHSMDRGLNTNLLESNPGFLGLDKNVSPHLTIACSLNPGFLNSFRSYHCYGEWTLHTLTYTSNIILDSGNHVEFGEHLRSQGRTEYVRVVARSVSVLLKEHGLYQFVKSVHLPTLAGTWVRPIYSGLPVMERLGFESRPDNWGCGQCSQRLLLGNGDVTAETIAPLSESARSTPNRNEAGFPTWSSPFTCLSAGQVIGDKSSFPVSLSDHSSLSPETVVFSQALSETIY